MDTYRSLSHRTALVTGAASGIGAAIAQLLVASGARTALLSRRADRLDALVAELGPRALSVPADVTDQGSLTAAIDVAHRALGPFDLVVHAAGVMYPNPIGSAPSSESEAMINTNLRAAVAVTQATLPDLLAAGEAQASADLVFISSLAARNPLAEYAVYNATKAAVTHLATSLRQELGPQGVRVSAVEPGMTRTELGEHITNAAHADQITTIRASATLEASDVADLVGYLTSRSQHVSIGLSTISPTAHG